MGRMTTLGERTWYAIRRVPLQNSPLWESLQNGQMDRDVLMIAADPAMITAVRAAVRMTGTPVSRQEAVARLLYTADLGLTGHQAQQGAAAVIRYVRKRRNEREEARRCPAPQADSSSESPGPMAA